MKYLQMKSKRKLINLIMLLLLIVILNISSLFGSKPNISISSSALYPRLSMMDTEEQTHWRSIFSYDQKFGNKVGIDGLFEYGSENNHFQNPFRVHHLTADLNFLGNEFSIGRIAIWNALQNARVDGAQLNIKTNKTLLNSIFLNFMVL